MTTFKGRKHRVHLVGIGGIGMSGIAEVLLDLGYVVSGSDLKQSDLTRRLEARGGKIFVGHSAEHLREVDVVVVSSAVKPDNPEVAAARRRAIPVIRRAEMLAELMRLKVGVAVAGSHGKTTTTSMVAAILDRGGVDPTVVIGGKVNALGSNARVGQGDYLVAEADESDGSFLKLSPTLAVVTNIEPEHLDHYGSLEKLRESFLDFVNKVPFYGLAVLCLDCPNLQSLMPRVEKRFVTYGSTPQADYSFDGLAMSGAGTTFRPVRRGVVGEEITLRMVGRHNVLNAIAALAIADELEIPAPVIAAALGEFGGVQRRFTVRGEVGGVMVVDDYGHHPTEIRATLAGAREAYGRRLVAVFQPHRFSRLQDQFEQFATAFYDANVVLVAEVYAAGEDPIAGLDGQAIARAIRRHGHRDVTFCESPDALVSTLAERSEPGDLVITLGAGDIWRAGQALLDALGA